MVIVKGSGEEDWGFILQADLLLCRLQCTSPPLQPLDSCNPSTDDHRSIDELHLRLAKRRHVRDT